MRETKINRQRTVPVRVLCVVCVCVRARARVCVSSELFSTSESSRLRRVRPVRGLQVPVFHHAGTILAALGHGGALMVAYAAFVVRVCPRVSTTIILTSSSTSRSFSSCSWSYIAFIVLMVRAAAGVPTTAALSLNTCTARARPRTHA